MSIGRRGEFKAEMPADIRRAFESVTGLSPERKLAKKLNDLEAQHYARGGWEDLPQQAGPMPTIYNAGTGEWDEVTPDYGRLKNVPLGAPRADPAILNRMRSGRVMENPLLLYGNDWAGT
jgi:hypothetical protein